MKCLFGHDWEVGMLTRQGMDTWNWLLCCSRCGKWDDIVATDQMVEFLKGGMNEPEPTT